MVVVRPQFQNVKKSKASGNKRGSAAVVSTRAALPSSKNDATHVGPGGETPRRRRRRNPSEKAAAAAASKFNRVIHGLSSLVLQYFASISSFFLPLQLSRICLKWRPLLQQP